MCWDNSQRPVRPRPVSCETSSSASEFFAQLSSFGQIPQYLQVKGETFGARVQSGGTHGGHPPMAKPASAVPEGRDAESPRAKRQAVVGQESMAVDSEPQAEDPTLSLPDECISQIFGLIEEVKDRYSCALVCRRWLHLQGLLRPRGSCPYPPKKTSPPAPAPAQAHAQPADLSNPDASEGGDLAGGLARTLDGKHACDARLMAMAVALGPMGGLEQLTIRATGGRRRAGARESRLPLSASGLLAMAQSSPELRSLSIWDCDWLDDETVCVVARWCHQLERLDVINCPRMTDRALIALARGCPNLKHLSLSSCGMVSDKGLEVLSQGCRDICGLTLSGLPFVFGRGIASIGRTNKDLKAVKLSKLGVTDEGLTEVGNSVCAVQQLKLSQLQRVTEGGFKSIGCATGFKHLNTLSVSACPGLTPESLGGIGAGCVELKSVGLVKCKQVTDHAVGALLRSVTGLESLVLHQLPAITKAAVQHAMEHGQCLKSLAISSCPGLEDTISCAADWSVSCPKLSSLKISNCVAVGSQCLSSMCKTGHTLSTLDLCGLPLAEDKGVMSFLQSSSKLCSIDLSGCAQITDKTVTSITEHCGDTVRSLSLDGCKKITDKSLRAIAKACTVLEDLDLSECDVSDKGLEVLVGSVGHSLVNLSLSGCHRVTDRSLKNILEACHSLSGLNLKKCPGLSRAAVMALRREVVGLCGPSCLFIDP